MTITIRVTIDDQGNVEQVARFERGELQGGNLGLTFGRSKIVFGSRAKNDGAPNRSSR
jgi:hypothetical protein